MLSFLGDPNIALLIGVLLVFIAARSFKSGEVKAWTEEAVRRGGAILLLLCAGGALESRLAMTGVGQEIGKTIRLVAKLVSSYSHLLNSADSMLYHYFFGKAFKTF